MALFCRADCTSQCPKLGGERTKRGHAVMAESDLERPPASASGLHTLRSLYH